MEIKPKICTTDGQPPREGYEYGKQGAPAPINPATGQHESYWVLCEEERQKGLVRPVRRSYIHCGERPKYPTRPLTAEEYARYGDYGYVVFETYPEGSEEAKGSTTGRFWTEKQLHSGCGCLTTMGRALAETYARDPKFYGATFCCDCGGHFPVAEFVWEDGTVVGS